MHGRATASSNFSLNLLLIEGCYFLYQDEEFLFEKGDLNLWAEPMLWARMLHGHLCALLSVPHSPGVSPEDLERLSAVVKINALTAEQAMKNLPAFPQFSATIEYGKIMLLKERSSLAQSVLDTLRQAEKS